MTVRARFILAVVFFGMPVATAVAGTGPSGADSALIIYDTSGSMAWTGNAIAPRWFQPARKGPMIETGMVPPTRLDHAIDVASATIDEFTRKHYDMGLIVFGQGGCDRVELMVQLGGTNAADAIRSTLFGLKPHGLTPLTAALDKASEYIKNGGFNVREVVLITDGIETCRGDAKGAAAALGKLGANLKIIGLDIVPSLAAQLEDIARAAGGSYQGQHAVGFGGDSAEYVAPGSCGPCELLKAARMGNVPAAAAPPAKAPPLNPMLPPLPPATPPPIIFTPPAGGIFPDDDGSKLKQ